MITSVRTRVELLEAHAELTLALTPTLTLPVPA